MTYSAHQKGSQWRKWDLHVHTPASFHWNGGKLLNDMTDSEKEEMFGQLLATLEASDVAVFCFTDYWTFDGYLEFRKYLRGKKLNCSKTIFPGMELRIEAPVDYRLNLQVVLSDSLTEQQLRDSKSRLRLRIGSVERSMSDEAITMFAKTLDASKAQEHGFDDPSKLSRNELLRLGAMTVEVTKESLQAATKEVPPTTAYIVLPYDTSDGLEKLDWKTHPHADNYFMQTAHAFESRNEQVMKLFLGIETKENSHFIDNFQKTLNYVQKPVLCGSDAHCFSDYGRFPGNRITWIKADPTFQGFRQIFFEARERVRIQELPPEEKTPYLIIDKVRFIDNTDGKAFSDDWIELNPNLNTVIGGKSSGKSLLLYHIVKTVAPDLLERRSDEVTIPQYRFGEEHEFDFEVQWKDGHVDRLSDLSEEGQREIEFIPQMYLNSLAEKQGRRSLYQLIESILEQNAEYRAFIEEKRKEISQLERAIETNLNNLLNLRRRLKRLYSERKEIGSRQAIEQEVDRLSRRIKVLKENSGFNEEEQEQYELLQKLEHSQIGRQRKYDNLYRDLVEWMDIVDQVEKNMVEMLQNALAEIGSDKFSRRVIVGLSETASERITNTFASIVKVQNGYVDKVGMKVNELENEVQRLREHLKPYHRKVSGQDELKRLSSSLNEERRKLARYREKEAQVDSVKEHGLLNRERLLENYQNLFQCYRNIVSMLQLPQYAEVDSELKLEARLEFDTETFSEAFSNLFDRRTRLRDAFGSCYDEHNDFYFEIDTHIDTITKIYDILSNAPDSIRFKQRATVDNAISSLFKNYFTITYNIRYKEDGILDMSPGKRGLVLLQLILHISNATHPILIDQPEDNLDNRTISRELRDFVKTKKISRQIVMITHDANLVVLTDAENVIVSNQAGQQVDRENSKFRFEYVTGALEHSFRFPEHEADGVLLSCGIREHVCDILEGGEEAFKKREQRYSFLSN